MCGPPQAATARLGQLASWACAREEIESPRGSAWDGRGAPWPQASLARGPERGSGSPGSNSKIPQIGGRRERQGKSPHNRDSALSDPTPSISTHHSPRKPRAILINYTFKKIYRLLAGGGGCPPANVPYRFEDVRPGCSVCICNSSKPRQRMGIISNHVPPTIQFKMYIPFAEYNVQPTSVRKLLILLFKQPSPSEAQKGCFANANSASKVKTRTQVFQGEWCLVWHHGVLWGLFTCSSPWPTWIWPLQGTGMQK